MRVRAFSVIAAVSLIPTCASAASQAKQKADQAPAVTANDSRGSQGSPIVVKVLPTTKTQEEAAKEQAKQDDESAANWAMVKLTIVLSLIALIQTIVAGWQARRLRQTIEKMDEIAAGQKADTHASIAEATRAAKAMEGIATSMAANVGLLRDAMNVNKQIATNQQRVMVLQNRAILELLDIKVFRVIDEVPQEERWLVSASDCAIRFFIKNRGASAATLHRITEAVPLLNIEDTRELDTILDAGHWVQQTIPFRLPDSSDGEADVLSNFLTLTLIVDYSDGFARRTKLFCRGTVDHMVALTTNSEKPIEQQWRVYGGTPMNSEMEHKSYEESQSDDQSWGRQSDLGASPVK